MINRIALYGSLIFIIPSSPDAKSDPSGLYVSVSWYNGDTLWVCPCCTTGMSLEGFVFSDEFFKKPFLILIQISEAFVFAASDLSLRNRNLNPPITITIKRDLGS